MPEQQAATPTMLATKAGNIVTRGGFIDAFKGPILDILKQLFQQLLGGLCPKPTPAQLFDRLTGTAPWGEDPSGPDDRRQRVVLDKACRQKFGRNYLGLEFIEEAVWEEKLATTQAECEAIVSQSH